MRSSIGLCALAAMMVLAEPAGPARAEQPANDDERARELFRLGENHYAAGHYEKAALLYDEAYRLSGRAELLLAIVNTYERMGEYAQAAEYLRQYLKHPKARNVTSLRERLRRLENAEGERAAERERLRQLEISERERRQDQSAATTEQAQPKESAVVGPGGPNPGPAASPSAPSRLPAYLFLGGGVAGLGGAVGFGLAARKAGQDVDEQCVADGVCRDRANSALDREKRYSLLADVSAVVGVASAAIGVYFLWKRRGQATETRRAFMIAPTAVPSGLGVGVVADF